MSAFNRLSISVSALIIFSRVFLFRAAKFASALVVAGIFVSGVTQYAQERLSPISASMPPRELTFAELAKHPSVFDKQRIRLTAFINFAFEDFTIWDPECPRNEMDFALWITYGGTANSGAVYCCPGEGTPRTSALSFPLIEDKTFKDFRSLLSKERDTVVRATVVGTFLARPQALTRAEQRISGGYGHMGCCSLLVIEQIASFEPHARKDLDYSATSGFYGRSKSRSGCSEHWDLTDINGDIFLGPSYGGGQSFIREQAAADAGERSWAFTDPARIALEAVRRVHGDGVKSLKPVQALQGQKIFEWQHNNKSVTTVVVARPYWLSYYAISAKVAWVVTAMKTMSCTK